MSIPSWDEFFMGIALTAAYRSPDPNTQVGAVIVSPQHIILGIGYNGHPRGCNHLPLTPPEKYYYMAHAELNAIINCSASPAGSTLYCLLEPCCNCAQAIINAQIKEVVFMCFRENATEEFIAARKMFQWAGTERREFGGSLSYMKKTPLMSGKHIILP